LVRLDEDGLAQARVDSVFESGTAVVVAETIDPDRCVSSAAGTA
jgi:hypothetical protein